MGFKNTGRGRRIYYLRGPRPATYMARARMERVICFGCKCRGHFRRDCPLSGQFALQYTEPVACVEGLERLSFVELDYARANRAKLGSARGGVAKRAARWNRQAESRGRIPRGRPGIGAVMWPPPLVQRQHNGCRAACALGKYRSALKSAL